MPSFTKVEQGVETATGGAGGTTAATGGSGGSSPGVCKPLTYPAPPSVKNAGGDITFIGAVHKVFLTHDADGGPLGLDLDQACTCFGDDTFDFAKSNATCVPSSSSQEPKNHWYCDTPTDKGVDDSTTQIFLALGLLLGKLDIDGFYSQTATQGNWGLLLQVSDYDGKADDDQVTVAIIGSPGFAIVGGPPKWDGSDSWPVSSTSFGVDATKKPDLTKPLFVDKNAYVSNHQLVASMPETRVELAAVNSRVKFQFTGGGALATIDTDAQGKFVLRKGLLTARAGAKEMFQAVASYRDSNGNGMCTDSPFYTTIKSTLCDRLDILKTIGSKPTSACDAISFAIGFETDPAKLGMPVVPAPDKPVCLKNNDPANDCCECPFGMVLKMDGSCACVKP